MLRASVGLDNLKIIIDLEYSSIKDKIIYYGNKTHQELHILYGQLSNRIFLFTSISETFGKTPMEAGAMGVPIFIKKSSISDDLYINKKNAFVFDNKEEFKELFEYFIKLDKIDKQLIISNSINNIKKYNQENIFSDWTSFILNEKIKKNTGHINFYEMLSFHGISQFINCSGNISDLL